MIPAFFNIFVLPDIYRDGTTFCSLVSSNFEDVHLTPLFDIIHDTARREGHKNKKDTFTGGKGIVYHEKLGDKAIGPLVKNETQIILKNNQYE